MTGAEGDQGRGGTMEWDVVIDGLSRPEAPCPDGDDAIWCSDIFGDGAILRLGLDGTLEQVCARQHVGGIVPHESGGVVASGHDLAVVARDGTQRVVLAADGIWGYNDITTDFAGNVFAGRHDDAPTIDPPEKD